MTDFTDYRQSKRDSYYIGYISLFFRDSNTPSKDLLNTYYILNSFDDTWFRCDYGNASHYGLAITNIKFTTKKSVTMGDYICYKVKVSYHDWYEDIIKEEFMWLSIQKNFKVEDVMEYIEQNMKHWKP